MSARSCQLCGKPLSRIWVGSDGDFCSREHRNQFRLRQGMGRLQEANKVASVMRRREHLKPLPTSGSLQALSVTPRGFFTPAFSTVRHGIAIRPTAAPATAAHLVVEMQGFFPAKAAPGKKQRPLMGGTTEFAVRRRPVMARQRLNRLPVAVQAAPCLRPRRRTAKNGLRRIEFSMARNSARRLEFRARRPQAHGVQLPGALQNTRGGTKNTAAVGKALRVSAACAFRLRRNIALRADHPRAAVLGSGLPTPESRFAPMPRPLPQAKQRSSSFLKVPLGEILAPAVPAPARALPELKRKAAPTRPFGARRGAMPAARAAAADWSAPAERLLLPANRLQNWKPGQADALPHLAVRPLPARGTDQFKSAVAPFVPQDVSCEYSFNVGQTRQQGF